MGSGSLSRVRLYAPFLALIAVQALLVALVPSTASSGGAQAGFGAGQDSQQAVGDGAGGDGGFEGSAVDVGGNGGGPDVDDDGGATSGGGATAGGSSSSGGAGTGGGAGSGGDQERGDGGGQVQAVGGDTSHCTERGRQHGVTYHAPTCVPAWEGSDNGGTTYRGVSEDSIKVVWFTTETNEQVAAISEAAGSDTTEQDRKDMLEALADFIPQHYETYGRGIEIKYVEADCPQTPPDVPACRAEARKMLAEEDPFAVIWSTPLYPQVFDEFAREGVLTLGGWHFEERFFEGRRPFRWDLNMDGTQSGDFIAEYYCKKLAGDNASHAGQMIHPSIGPRDTTQRKMGILTPETDANVAAADHVRQQVMECAGEDVPLITYESDIERAQEQSTANAAAMIDAGVTTMVCMCDPIAPVFTTRTYTGQSYFPEHMLAGIGFMDLDEIGRLYDSEQWQHAFGLSHLAAATPFEESDSQAVWGASGRDGEAPCPCGLETAYSLILASMIQGSGPDLTPHNVEQGVFEADASGGWDATGGDPEIVKIDFGPGDYTAISDVREVYWDSSAVSNRDGEPGAYVPMNDGRRYVSGQLPSGFDIPQPSR